MTTVLPAQASAPATSVTPPPRTWSFVDRRTGEAVEYRCMDNCTLDHGREVGRAIFREDVWCWTWAESMTLPVNENGTPEEMAVLSTVIKVEPFSRTISQRLPYAVVELVEDQFIENLDPDGYETLIRTLSDRLDQMRATHRRLVGIRAAYMARQVRAA